MIQAASGDGAGTLFCLGLILLLVILAVIWWAEGGGRPKP